MHRVRERERERETHTLASVLSSACLCVSSHTHRQQTASAASVSSLSLSFSLALSVTLAHAHTLSHTDTHDDAGRQDKTRHSLSPPRGHSHAQPPTAEPEENQRNHLWRHPADSEDGWRGKRKWRGRWRRGEGEKKKIKCGEEERKVPAKRGGEGQRKARVALEEKRGAGGCTRFTFYCRWSEKEKEREWAREQEGEKDIVLLLEGEGERKRRRKEGERRTQGSRVSDNKYYPCREGGMTLREETNGSMSERRTKKRRRKGEREREREDAHTHTIGRGRSYFRRPGFLEVNVPFIFCLGNVSDCHLERFHVAVWTRNSPGLIQSAEAECIRKLLFQCDNLTRSILVRSVQLRSVHFWCVCPWTKKKSVL